MGMTAYWVSLGAVVLAEMGDKTQLLAMALATRYKAWIVMLGVLIATLLNHALAVAAGSFIASIPWLSKWISAVAAVSFVFFGLWTLRGDKLDGEENRFSKFGPLMTVILAFFVAELGDKTQLATISLATQYPHNGFMVLMGTTTGMLVADAIGIFVGAVLFKWVPENIVKMISAGAFMVFGYIGIFQALRGGFALGLPLCLAILVFVMVISLIIAVKLIRSPARQTD